MKKPTLTVLVPSRERADTLAYTLKTICRQKERDFTILVSDNASQDHTRQVVEGFRDSRVRYINPGRRLNMAQHFEFALGHITSDYVLFLGDDDGLLPDSVARINELIARHGNPPAIKSVESYFVWHTVTSPEFGFSPPRTLYFPFSGREEWRSGADVLEKYAHFTHPCPWHDWHEMPCHYWGVIRMDKVREVQRTGPFFRSRFPDVYSAIVLAAVCDKFIHCAEPFVLPGTSHNSTGLSLCYRVPGKGDISPGAVFDGEANLPWHPKVPYSGTSQVFFKWEAFRHACDTGLVPTRIQWDEDAMLRAGVAEAMAKPPAVAELELSDLERCAATLGKTFSRPPLGAVAPASAPAPLRYYWTVGILVGQCRAGIRTIDDATRLVGRRRRWRPILLLTMKLLHLPARLRRLFSTAR